MNAAKEKLFRLYADAIPPGGDYYIPDSLGEYSPYLDPRHDSMGRELVTCFLVDSKGHVAMFLNRLPCDYVPYNILFHPEAYNRFMQEYFPKGNDDALYTEQHGFSTIGAEHFYQEAQPVYEYLQGKISLRQTSPFQFFAELYRLIKAGLIIRFDKKLRAKKFRQWKALKRYYQSKGLYVYAPSPDFSRLVRIFSPNRLPDNSIAEQVSVFSQTVSLDFSTTRSIDFSDLKKMWIPIQG